MQGIKSRGMEGPRNSLYEDSPAPTPLPIAVFQLSLILSETPKDVSEAGVSEDTKAQASVGEELHTPMARGGHGLPKASPGPAMLYPSMPYGRATAELALWPF
jgi:hypothetical protein